MNESGANRTPDSVSTTDGEAEAIVHLLIPQLDQLVIVVPDSMEIDPIDYQWIAQNNPFHCRIILLGKCKAHKRLEIAAALYREVIFKLIAAGVRVIHKHSLEGTNAKYLEAHPDAEGIPLWCPKPRR
ncbi:MAG TPA: hypothetical protein VFW23_18890 [Tepidisphaeraceae bacterium]|nr:hypothetical protein [Tepidisphaeraceae bacterium]